MKSVRNFLDGKKTYITVGLGIALNFCVYMNWLSVDQISQINAVLAFLGLHFLRVSISKV